MGQMRIRPGVRHGRPQSLAFLAGLVLVSAAGVSAQSPNASEPTSSGGGEAVRSPGCGQANPAEVPAMLSLTSGGMDREALVHIPPSAEPSVPLPLVLAFHGYGAGPYDQEYLSDLSSTADAGRFIVAYPAGTGDPRRWDLAGDTDTTFVNDLITTLGTLLCVDERRVYATGFSMGGGMSNVLGCRLEGRIAAIAPVAALHGDAWGGKCTPSRPVAMMAFHGVLDDAVPYEGGELAAFPEFAGRPASGVEAWAAGWARIDGCGAAPTVTTVVDGVDSLVWPDCVAPVQLYRIADGKHSWPGGNSDPAGSDPMRAISASELISAFFEENPLPAP